MNRIPKKIHYCRFGGKKLTRLERRCIKSWKKVLKDYEIIEWNEKNFDISIAPCILKAHTTGWYPFVSDYVKLHALYHFGGICLDTNVEIKKNLRGFHGYELFIGRGNPDWVDVSLIGAEKGNEFIKNLLSYYQNCPMTNTCGEFSLKPVDHVVTEFLSEMGLVKKNVFQVVNHIIILPTEFFSPMNPVTKECKMSWNTYAIHHFTESKGTNPIKIKLQAFINKIAESPLLRKIKNMMKKFKKII